MTPYGASRAEWLGAALVITVTVASTLLLQRHVASVDAATELRRERIEALEEQSATHVPPALDAPRQFEQSFDGHGSSPAPLLRGAFRGLHGPSCAGDRR